MHLSEYLPLFTALAGSVSAGATTAKALYTLDNESPNHVVAFELSAEGYITGEGLKWETGGNGAAYATVNLIDALESQDSIIVRGDTVVVVNAGSNSISFMNIDPDRPTRLTIDDVQDLQGEFPNSIAVSEVPPLVCISTAGVLNGIECVIPGQGKLRRPDGVGLRSLGLNSTNPPDGNHLGLADIFFSADSKWLYAVIRGTPQGDTGYLATYPVINDTVAATPIISNISGVLDLFTGFEIPNTNSLYLSDAKLGGVLVKMDENGHGTTVKNTKADPFVLATCWAAYSNASGTAWLGSPNVNAWVAVNTTTGDQISNTNFTMPNLGILDIAIPFPGNVLYALAPGQTPNDTAAVTVFDITDYDNPYLIQYFPVVGASVPTSGMAFWPDN